MDAPRVQVCPFKDRESKNNGVTHPLLFHRAAETLLYAWPAFPAGLDELWFGITFDPLEEALIWKPACPVAAVAGLCEKREDGACVDLPDSSQNVSRDKVEDTRRCAHIGAPLKFKTSIELNMTDIFWDG